MINSARSSHLLFYFFQFIFFIAVANGQSNTNNGMIQTGSLSEPRKIISFDNDWRFLSGDDPAAKEIKFDDSHWRTLNLPHDWSIEGPVNPPPLGDRNTGYFSHGIGWYRKNFPSPDTAKKVVIEFDAIYI